MVTVICVVLVDFVSKAYISSTMVLHESVPVIEGFFNITYVRNPGAAFGLFSEASGTFRLLFFVAVTVLAIVLVLYYIVRSSVEESLVIFSLSLILSGAVGNLIDRVCYGEVVDFLDVYIGSHHWPAFNVADSAITVGALILFFELCKRKKYPERSRSFT